jgi:hypothetical protein
MRKNEKKMGGGKYKKKKKGRETWLCMRAPKGSTLPTLCTINTYTKRRRKLVTIKLKNSIVISNIILKR